MLLASSMLSRNINRGSIQPAQSRERIARIPSLSASLDPVSLFMDLKSAPLQWPHFLVSRDLHLSLPTQSLRRVSNTLHFFPKSNIVISICVRNRGDQDSLLAHAAKFLSNG